MTTSDLRLTAPLSRSWIRRASSALTALATVAGSILLAWITVSHPEWNRFLLAVVVGVSLLALAVRWPREAAVCTLIFLPFLALLRRLLISSAGWTAYDPLLLVAPLVALVLIGRLLIVERRPLGGDTVSNLVLGLLALAVLQVFNPLGSGPLAGLAGLLYLAVPLLWFLIGRELADRRAILFLVYAAVAIAVAEGIYGLVQTESGLPAWDQRWVDTTGYEALYIGEDQIRAFGTFPSAAEYAAFVGVGLVFAVAMTLHRRALLVLTVPFLAVALFLTSGRAVLVLAILGVLGVLSLRTGMRGRAAMVLVLGVAAVFAVAILFGPALDRAAGRSDSPNVSRQLGGLLHPLDPERSTLIGHFDLVTKGIEDGVSQPLGRGTAATNLAGTRFGSSTTSTEIDLSDVFVSLGLLGGVLFLPLIFLTFQRVIRRYLTGHDPALLAVLGMLVVTLGQWLNGAHYTLASLTWFVIGWATRERPSP
jgi:hypothetical protein